MYRVFIESSIVTVHPLDSTYRGRHFRPNCRNRFGAPAHRDPNLQTAAAVAAPIFAGRRLLSPQAPAGTKSAPYPKSTTIGG